MTIQGGSGGFWSSAFWRVTRHEWRMLHRDRAFWIGAMLLAIAVAYASITGVSWIRFQQRTIAGARADQAHAMVTQRTELAEIAEGKRQAIPWTDPRNPAVTGGVSHGGRLAAMPPGPLGMLAIGQSDLYPYYVTVSIQGREAFMGGADEIENPQVLFTGRFDLAFVIIYLFPLVILALSFNALSQEKEQGTLPLVLSQQVSLRTLVATKVLVRAALIVAIVVGVALITSAFGMSSTTAQGEAVGWRLVAWTLAVSTYGFFWFALAVLVNARGRGSAANAVVLAGLWLLFVLIVPTLVNTAASVMYPIASRVEMIQATRRATDAANARAGELLGRFFQDHPDMVRASAPVNMDDFYSRRIAVQEDTERQTRPVIDRFTQQLAQRERLVNRFQYLSPAIVAQMLFNDIAGSSSARARDFAAQVEAYHHEWRGYFYPRILQRVSLRPADWDDMPAFVYRPEADRAVAARALAGLAGLTIPTLLVSALALLRLRRYPIVG